jgi:transcriptional regulator with XRE-family HTH domain
LAERLGLTFQQVQKYERGTNRISASKLFEIARALNVVVGFFYEGLDDPGAPDRDDYTRAWSQVFEALIADPNGHALAEAYLAIRRQSVRRALVDMVRAVATNDQNGPAVDKAAAE